MRGLTYLLLVALGFILLRVLRMDRNRRNHVKGLHTAAVVLENLSQIPLPDLPRPPGLDTNPNDELVYWGIRVYSYAMVANLREILRGILLLNGERDAVGVY